MLLLNCYPTSFSNELFFFFHSGNQYYRFNTFLNRIDDGYPRPLSIWNLQDGQETPITKLDEAFQWTRYGRTYFFFENQYIRFDDQNFRPDDTYPRSTAYWWFACGDQAYIRAENGAMTTVVPSVFLLSLSAFLTLLFL